MECIDFIIQEIQELNYDVAESNIETVLKNQPAYDNIFIAVEDGDEEFVCIGDSPYRYEVESKYEIAIFIQNATNPQSLAREVKQEVIDKISTMKFENLPFYIERIRREKNNETNVGAYIVEINLKYTIDIQ